MTRMLAAALCVLAWAHSGFAQVITTRAQREDVRIVSTVPMNASNLTTTFSIQDEAVATHAVQVRGSGTVTGVTVTIYTTTDGVSWTSSGTSSTIPASITFTGSFASVRVTLDGATASTPDIFFTYYGQSAIAQNGGSLFTQGSVIFAGTSGLLSEDNASFNFDDNTNTLTVPALIDTTFTQGSVLFAGTSGIIAQDNTVLFFNDNTNALVVTGAVGIGTTPAASTDLDILRATGAIVKVARSPASAVSGDTLGQINFYNGTSRAALIAGESGGSTDSGQVAVYTTASGGALTLSHTVSSAGNILPGTDNAITLGDATHRFASVRGVGILATTYATSGNITILKTGTPTAAGNGTLVSNSLDSMGKVAFNNTGASTITLTFSSAFTRAPACSTSNETTANLLRATSTTTTVALAGVTVDGDVASYICHGY